MAFFLRYPNPFARHVLSVDVLDRHVDPSSGQIRTTRLILKRGIMPKWATSWMPVAGASGGRGLDAWVLEESVVDPPGWGESSHMAQRAQRTAARVGSDEEELDRTPFGWVKDEPPERGDVAYGRDPRLRVQQGNLNHRKFMHVIEGGEIRAGPKG